MYYLVMALYKFCIIIFCIMKSVPHDNTAVEIHGVNTYSERVQYISREDTTSWPVARW